jgi:hypothetical protein
MNRHAGLAMRLLGYALLVVVAFGPAVVAYRLPEGQPWDTLEFTIIGLYVVVFAYALYRSLRHRSQE